MNKIKHIDILLIDDHQIFLDGMKLLLGTVTGINVVAAYTNGNEALEALNDEHVDVVITDLSMPIIGGSQLISAIKLKHPKIKCMALTMLNDFLSVNESLEAGADAYLLKNTTIAELEVAINHVLNDKIYVSPEINMLLVQNVKKNASVVEALTPREKEILNLIISGFSSKQMADELNLSVETIKFHRKNILSKLNQPNVASLVSFALKNRIT